jgi:hypothetical protein
MGEPLSREDVAAIIANAVAAALGQYTRGAGNEETPPPPPVNQHDLTDTRWRASDIGYFDPDLAISEGEGDYVSVGNNIY